MMRRLVAFLVLFAVAFVPSACTDEPSGPGTLEVAVSAGIPLGAVVVEFTGEGLRGASAASDVWLHAEAGQGTLRVMAVARQAGVFTFELEVDDLGAPLPTARVISAARGDDRTLPSGAGVDVSITP